LVRSPIFDGVREFIGMDAFSVLGVVGENSSPFLSNGFTIVVFFGSEFRSRMEDERS